MSLYAEPQGLLVVVTGPSGVGKGTVVGHLLAAIDDAERSISVTTRSPRPGEVDGVDYHFVDADRFAELVDEDALLEWAEYAGQRYGTPASPVEDAVDAGRIVILEIEVQGALQVRQRREDALLVFLQPPSTQELERRLRGRGTESELEIHRRLKVARAEMKAAGSFDVLLVNEDAEVCANRLEKVIRRARSATGSSA
ncbi:MAG TPA: guanylate kinase [Nitriliruptorales bacterium]